MLTVTARKHLINGLVTALRIFPYQAEEILGRHENARELDFLASPLHGIKILICEGHGTKSPMAHLFRNAFNKGFEPIGILHLRETDLTTWLWDYQDEARTIARAVTADIRRDPARSVEDESWLTATIIGYQKNVDHYEFDIQTDEGRLLVGVSSGTFEAEHFLNNSSALINYTSNLLGCRVDLLIAPSLGADRGRFDFRIVGIIPGGAKASQNDALASEASPVE